MKVYRDKFDTETAYADLRDGEDATEDRWTAAIEKARKLGCKQVEMYRVHEPKGYTFVGMREVET